MRETIDVITGMAVVALDSEHDYKLTLESILDYIAIKEEEGEMLREATHKAKVERLERHRLKSETRSGHLYIKKESRENRGQPLPVSSAMDDKGNVTLQLMSDQFRRANEDRLKLLQAIESLCPTMQVPMSRLEEIYGRPEAVRIVNAFIAARKLAKSVRESLYK